MSNNFNVTAALNKNGTISCSWSGVAGADSYQVRICDFGSKVFYHEVITYDALGRIKTHTGTSAVPEYAFSRSYAYDALGQLASYSDGENAESYLYDALGNRTQKQAGGKTAAAYQYNAMNQITAMTQGEETYSYLYDQHA